MTNASPATATSAAQRRYAYWLVGAFAFGWMVISADASVINPLLPFGRS